MKKFGTVLNITSSIINLFGSSIACVIASGADYSYINEGLLPFIPAILLLVGAGMTISNKKITLMIGSIIVIISSICGLVLVNVFFLFGIVSTISGSFTFIASFEINKIIKVER